MYMCVFCMMNWCMFLLNKPLLVYLTQSLKAYIITTNHVNVLILYSNLLSIHSTQTWKGLSYIYHRAYAMTLQLLQPVCISCLDEFQLNLQEVTSNFKLGLRFKFTISSEIELCLGPNGIDGIMRISEMLKKKSIQVYFFSGTPKSVCQPM